ncbi:xanthine dehydrogenase small subunit [Bosea sp. (in: a-proteobacteria)]|jgi:xanthine dehydrogenase small subunit|uniref:xanthine dehydrogenase small subunit n=1 Tax=Bosea sp. (in: a-proteobacteria) TaxID=1871050 RepID=UPI002DDD6CE2|nr:xanthine dehydrogenase small subunit [Bosea sp. (in: a-proteobacteria)]HEV2513440.1 xanthine dehydrogenase small subunit [Bosea sp. (in: a-proteobacteria)]
MRESVRFLLGDELVEIASCDPTRTVLDWLRLDRRRTGTKEGCAEGDCGACTIVVGRLDGERLRYEAINACIRFLPTLDGCHVLTVEHLKSTDGTLHPVQQAMVDCHGSQCGFCTPGFVMSLLALWLNERAPSVQRIEDALAGNLCRCTGYEPIIAAAQRMDGAEREQDRFVAAMPTIIARLKALADNETIAIGDGQRDFYAPATVAALAELIGAHPQATLVAGATDVGLWVTKGMRRLNPVISLGRIDELRAISDTGDHLRFGAMANQIAVREALAGISPQLDEMMRRFGGEQVRNAGTIGGNIANGSPIGDLPPALIALGATLVLRRGGERRSLPLEAFFLDYRKQDRQQGEFVEAVLVPKLPAGTLFHISKISKRFDEDISAVCGAFYLELDAAGGISDARLAYGGMAGIPKRAKTAEAALLGRSWDDAAVADAIAVLTQDFKPLTDMRASATYRLKVAGNLLRRFLIETTTPETSTRVAGLLAEATHG